MVGSGFFVWGDHVLVGVGLVSVRFKWSWYQVGCWGMVGVWERT